MRVAYSPRCMLACACFMCVTVCSSVLQSARILCVAVCCSVPVLCVLQCVAVCLYCVLQCVAECPYYVSTSMGWYWLVGSLKCCVSFQWNSVLCLVGIFAKETYFALSLAPLHEYQVEGLDFWLQHATTHCNALQHTATHYTTLQHTYQEECHDF